MGHTSEEHAQYTAAKTAMLTTDVSVSVDAKKWAAVAADATEKLAHHKAEAQM